MISRMTAGIFIAILFFAAPSFSWAADEQPGKPTATEDTQKKDVPAKPAAPVEETEEEAAWSGLVDSLWTSIRSMMTADEDAGKDGQVRYSATAGIRGAKTKGNILSPIWKGRAKDAHLPADAKLYNGAKADFEKQDYKEAAEKLKKFREIYKYSQLRPQAMLLLAISQAKDKDTQEAVKTLDGFLKEFPDHELAGEAKKLKSKMAKSETE